MRIFKSKSKNLGYFLYRLVNPIIDPIKLFVGIYGYFWFLKDIIIYKLNAPKDKILNFNLFPILDEKTNVTPFDAHYFYQEIWAFENIFNNNPQIHVDVASKYQFCGFISKITKTIFVDLRPIKASLKNLEVIKADILNLPFLNNSIESISCLHVAEHIGLGRYGDGLNPNGTKLACAELSRVLAYDGHLFFSLPIGKQRLCFNAHRIHNPRTILNYFSQLELVSFSVITDEKEYLENVNYEDFGNLNYGCGLFHFTKIK